MKTVWGWCRQHKSHFCDQLRVEGESMEILGRDGFSDINTASRPIHLIACFIHRRDKMPPGIIWGKKSDRIGPWFLKKDHRQKIFGFQDTICSIFTIVTIELKNFHLRL